MAKKPHWKISVYWTHRIPWRRILLVPRIWMGCLLFYKAEHCTWCDTAKCISWLIHMCVLCLIHVSAMSLCNMCAIDSWFVWHDWFIFVPWLIHTCAMTHSYVCDDSFTCVLWLIHMCAITPQYVCNRLLICVTRLIHTCAMTQVIILECQIMTRTFKRLSCLLSSLSFRTELCDTTDSLADSYVGLDSVHSTSLVSNNNTSVQTAITFGVLAFFQRWFVWHTRNNIRLMLKQHQTDVVSLSLIHTCAITQVIVSVVSNNDTYVQTAITFIVLALFIIELSLRQIAQVCEWPMHIHKCTHAHAQARSHTRTHAHAHARAHPNPHTPTHTHKFMLHALFVIKLSLRPTA